ncbi:MAG: energy transducer TonB [Balneola sp.]|jgi:protein TonB|nr:energy transducer TonB [Balneola sp.]
MKKNRYFDLKKNHFILSEIGIICSLLFLIAATNVNIGSEKDSGILEQPSIDPARIIDLPPVTPPEKVAPQKPMIFTPKPNDTPIDIDIPDFPDFGDFADRLPVPPKTETSDDEDIVDFLPIMPTIIGGQEALYSKIKYPKVAQNIGIEGRVHVQFIIDKQGRVTDPEIIRGVHPELDAEVLRVIKLVRFSPGVQNGVLVKVKMVQSVNFKLKR